MSISKQSTPPSEVPDVWYQVRKNIGDIRGTLPAGVVGPFFNDDFGDTYGIIYAFTADGFTFRELRDYVEAARSRLLQVPDVSKIEVLGAQDEQIYIEFSTERLAGLRLDYPTILAALQAQNIIRPAGVIQTGEERVFLRVSGAFDNERDIEAVNFVAGDRIFRLGDIATVRRGFADPPQPMFRVNGHPAIGLAIAMRDGGDILALGENIRKDMAEIKANLPVGIEPTLVADQAVTVDVAISDFLASLWQAILIILACSFVSLGMRPGTVVALAIPLTLAIVFSIMDIVHIDLHRISLGALIIALTLLVDDAMTTVDAMINRLAAGDTKEQAATYAYRTLAAPMLIGTFVTIASFVPIGFARSSAGEYTFSIFAVVAISLTVSWLVAVIFAPLIGKAILKVPESKADPKPSKIVSIYSAFLRGAIQAKWLTIGLTIAAFAAAIFLVRFVPRQFFPASDRPELTVDMTLRQNASIFATEEQAKRFEALLNNNPDVDHYSTYIGRGAIRFILTLNVQLANPFFAQFVIVAKDIDARERLQAKLEQALAEQFPDVVARISPLELGPPVGWPLQYRVSGPDKDQVRRIALDLATVIASDPRARHINYDWMEPARQVRVRIDQDEARQLGVNSAAIASVLNAAITGSTVTQVRDDIYLVNVVARATNEQRVSFQTLRSLQVPTPSGRMVPLSQFATFVEDQEYPLVWRRDRVPTLTVRADVEPRRAARRRSGHARAEDRRVQREVAEALQDRNRRSVRGERRFASVGVRRRAADDRADAHHHDGFARELPAGRDGILRVTSRRDRRRRRAARVQPSARFRRDPRHPRADRHDREERGDFAGADRDRPRRRQERTGRGPRRGHFAYAAADADRDLNRAGVDSDRADGVLGADGLRDYGRSPGGDLADLDFSADCVRDGVRRQGRRCRFRRCRQPDRRTAAS